MKESIGGTWLLGFVLVFIVIFSAYLAVSINYTKAFKVKNKSSHLHQNIYLHFPLLHYL